MRKIGRRALIKGAVAALTIQQAPLAADPEAMRTLAEGQSPGRVGLTAARPAGTISPLLSVSGSAETTTGSIAIGDRILWVAAVKDFRPGHGVFIAGAGAGSSDLITVVDAVTKDALILRDAAGVGVRHALVRHDDTAALQAALDTGVVYLSPGTYLVSGTLRVRSGSVVRGIGPTCTIRWSSAHCNCEGILVNKGSFPTQRLLDRDITICDLQLVWECAAPPPKQALLHMYLVDNLLLERVQVRGGGIVAVGPRVQVRGCAVQNSSSAGVDLGNSAKVCCEGNIIADVAGNGFSWHGSQASDGNCEIRGNIVSNVAGVGIDLGDAEGGGTHEIRQIRVMGNIIREARVGICVRGSSQSVTISCNSLDRPGTGILLQPGAGLAPTDALIEANTIHKPGVVGIHLAPVADDALAAQVTANLIRASGGHGIAVEARGHQVANVSMTSNHVSNAAAGHAGIHLYAEGAALRHCSIVGNRCWDDQPVPSQERGLCMELGEGGVIAACLIESNDLAANIDGPLIVGTGHSVAHNMEH